MNKTTIFTVLSAVSFTMNASADIDWTRIEQNNTNYVIDFDDTTSGTITNYAAFGLDPLTEIGTHPTAVYTAPINPQLESASDSIELIYNLGEQIDGTTFNMFYAWQWNDYKISISGGDGVIDATGITFGTVGETAAGQSGVDYNVLGSGTNSIVLDNLGSTQAFHGSFTINGTWDTISIKHEFNDDVGSARPVDSAAMIVPDGPLIVVSEVVPEPSSVSMLMLGTAGLLLRRRR